MPGPIENSKLARKIQSQRKAKGYRFHDNSVELILDGDKNVQPWQETDCYMLPMVQWEFFTQRYGIDIIIQKRKYENVDQMMPKVEYQKGQIYSTF